MCGSIWIVHKIPSSFSRVLRVYSDAFYNCSPVNFIIPELVTPLLLSCITLLVVILSFYIWIKIINKNHIAKFLFWKRRCLFIPNLRVYFCDLKKILISIFVDHYFYFIKTSIILPNKSLKRRSLRRQLYKRSWYYFHIWHSLLFCWQNALA